MEKVKLTQITRYDKKRDGTPLMGKFGPYKSIRIKTEEYGDRLFSGFENPKDASVNWNVGDVVEIETEQKGEYWNFKVSKEKPAIVSEDMMFIRTVLGRIIGKLEAIEEKLEIKPKAHNYPLPESDVIPFDD